jgi:hypothetical protein
VASLVVALLSSREAVAQDPHACALGRVYDTSNCCPLRRAVVTINNAETEETDDNGYYAIHIPAGLARVTVTANKGGFNGIDSIPAERDEHHVTHIAPIGLPPLIQSHNQDLRTQLQRQINTLQATRSDALRATATANVQTIHDLLATTRYTNRTVGMSVPVMSIEFRRGIRPTMFGGEPFAYRVPVQRYEVIPTTVQDPFDLNTPQEAQANAESIRLAESLLHSLQPQFATAPTAQRAF